MALWYAVTVVLHSVGESHLVMKVVHQWFESKPSQLIVFAIWSRMVSGS